MRRETEPLATSVPDTGFYWYSINSNEDTIDIKLNKSLNCSDSFILGINKDIYDTHFYLKPKDTRWTSPGNIIKITFNIGIKSLRINEDNKTREPANKKLEVYTEFTYKVMFSPDRLTDTATIIFKSLNTSDTTTLKINLNDNNFNSDTYVILECYPMDRLELPIYDAQGKKYAFAPELKQYFTIDAYTTAFNSGVEPKTKIISKDFSFDTKVSMEITSTDIFNAVYNLECETKYVNYYDTSEISSDTFWELFKYKPNEKPFKVSLNQLYYFALGNIPENKLKTSECENCNLIVYPSPFIAENNNKLKIKFVTSIPQGSYTVKIYSIYGSLVYESIFDKRYNKSKDSLIINEEIVLKNNAGREIATGRYIMFIEDHETNCKLVKKFGVFRK